MLEIILIVAILAADQITKYLADALLSPLGTSVPLIDGVFHLTSTHNTGAAWGLLPGKKWFFLILTLFVVVFLVFYLYRGRKRMTLLSRITLSLLLAGALGNAIDRTIFSYVRDFFDFCLINFPVFNIADSALTIGCILLMIDVLFMKERSMFEIKFGPRAAMPPSETEEPPDAKQHM